MISKGINQGFTNLREISIKDPLGNTMIGHLKIDNQEEDLEEIEALEEQISKEEEEEAIQAGEDIIEEASEKVEEVKEQHTTLRHENRPLRLKPIRLTSLNLSIFYL